MKVFISYSHQDKFAACMFELWIREAGLTPIRDESGFRPGGIPEEIKRHIGECDLFLAVLSPNFKESKWTADELGQARAFGRNILFVAISECVPEGPNQLKRPLGLWRKDAAVWRPELIRAIKDFQEQRGGEHTASLDQWLSRHYGCNQWVEQRVAYEHIAYSHLHVNSCVELASKWAGWKPDEIWAREAGDFRPEPEVLKHLPSGTTLDDYKEGDNYALKSFREDLSDEPWLDLTLQRVSHYLVRIVADNFEAIDKEEMPRRHLFEPGSVPFPHSVAVHMVLVTSDNYVLIGLRSARPRFYENCWAVSYEEHMRGLRDGVDPFKTAIRGIKEELIGEERLSVSLDCIRFFSLFRELDCWTNKERGETFWDINVGLCGIVKVPFSMERVFRNWLRFAEDKREFRHLVAIPYTFDNVLRLVETKEFYPTDFDSILLVPPGADRTFPDFNRKPLWRRQHPTNRIRLIRCLTHDFLGPLQRKVRVQLCGIAMHDH